MQNDLAKVSLPSLFLLRRETAYLDRAGIFCFSESLAGVGNWQLVWGFVLRAHEIGVSVIWEIDREVSGKGVRYECWERNHRKTYSGLFRDWCKYKVCAIEDKLRE